MDFDTDKYLQSKKTAFDPDSYLSDKGVDVAEPHQMSPDELAAYRKSVMPDSTPMTGTIPFTPRFQKAESVSTNVAPRPSMMNVLGQVSQEPLSATDVYQKPPAQSYADRLRQRFPSLSEPGRLMNQGISEIVHQPLRAVPDIANAAASAAFAPLNFASEVATKSGAPGKAVA